MHERVCDCIGSKQSYAKAGEGAVFTAIEKSKQFIS